jgi:hypothetical protein
MVDHYQCPFPGCNVDMTDAVCDQCKESSVIHAPLSIAKSAYVVDTARLRANVGKCELSQLRVVLQCPNGHWADYQCSGGQQ